MYLESGYERVKLRATVYLSDCHLQNLNPGVSGGRGEETGWSRKTPDTREILSTETMEENRGRAWGGEVHTSTYVLHEAGICSGTTQ